MKTDRKYRVTVEHAEHAPWHRHVEDWPTDIALTTLADAGYTNVVIDATDPLGNRFSYTLEEL